MKIKFENKELVVNNGIYKIRYNIGCLILSAIELGLYTYVWKKYGFKRFLLTVLALSSIEIGAWGAYVTCNVFAGEDNWYSRTYTKLADYVGGHIDFDEE